MRKLKTTLARMPIIGRILLFIFRIKTALAYFYLPAINLIRWLISSKETTNFTYELNQDNKRYLAALIADITGVEFGKIVAFIEEIEGDRQLKQHITSTTAKSEFSFMADKEVYFGRRVGWYTLVRTIKPKVVIETGIDKGLGACLLVAALKRNKEEGYEGKYYGTDINPKAGYLLSGDYATDGKILYGDSIETLRKFDDKIDLFINDSDHSADYEASEYKVIANKLSEKAIIIGDNAHYTNKLLEFSVETNRHFLFFQEKPHNHWYPGAGIGISFRR